MSETVHCQALPVPLSSRAAWALFLGCFMAVLAFCHWTGAVGSDLGGDPDEAAHAVTALMIRDYLADGLGQPPMKFAREYYEHFPRVALGHYPPFYYLVAGSFLLLWGSVSALFTLQAAMLAVMAVLIWSLGRRFLPSNLAGAAAVLGCALPVALKLVQHIMSDIMVVVLCLWAVWLWAGYLRQPSVKKALFWGCIAAAAILTKGSAIVLCLIPPMVTLLTGHWRLIGKLSWWCAAVPVGLLAGPWMLYSKGITQEGMLDLTPMQYLAEAAPFYTEALPFVFGRWLCLLAALGVLFGLGRCLKNRSLSPEAAGLLALMLGTVAVLLLLPAGMTTRYMLILVPGVLLAAAFGAQSVAMMLPQRFRKTAAMVLLLAAFVPAAGLPKKSVHGFSQAVATAGIPGPQEVPERWLISSDPRGEGAVIAAAAFGAAQRVPSNLHVHRGGKELASSDWLGRGYQAAVQTPETLLKLLDDRQITWVMVDLSAPEKLRRSHDLLLEQTLKASPEKWALARELPIQRQPGKTGSLLVFQRR